MSSSIGRKQIVSVTGLFLLLGFLVPHLGGNLFFFLGRDAYNGYARHLHDLGPILKVMEVVLLVAVLVHIVATSSLVLDNIRSRGEQKYSADVSTEKRSIATRTMPWTGAMILVFIILHLMSFKFGEAKPLGTHKDVYDQAMTLFGSPGWVAGYVIFMVAVGLHVSHALKSGFQTFGLLPTKYKTVAERASLTVGLAMFVLFGAIPVVAYLQGRSAETAPPRMEAPITETSGQSTQDK